MRARVSIMTTAAALALGTSAVAAPVAAALSGTASLSPNVPRKLAALKLAAGSLAQESSLPTGLTLTLQKGFAAVAVGSAASCTVAELDAAPDNQCPAASEVGTGAITVTPAQNLFGVTGSIPLALSFYRVSSQQAGCAASVGVAYQLVENKDDRLLNWSEGHGLGNLCAADGGVQLSFPSNSLPTYAYVSNDTPMIVNHVSLDLGTAAGAAGGLWRTPATCTKSREWSGSLAFAFAATTQQLPLKLACK